VKHVETFFGTRYACDWKLTVRALEDEEVKAWETAVTTLDKLFSTVTSDTLLDKL